MRVAFTGHEALVFNDYMDLATGRTLHAEPGQIYDVAPASGRPVPDFPSLPWFVVAEREPAPESEPQVEPEPEPADDRQDVPDSGDEPEPAQF